MAALFESWRADGKGQSRVASLRSDARGYTEGYADRWIAEQKARREVVLVTKGRTDKQSTWEKVLWTRPGYKDPVHEE